MMEVAGLIASTPEPCITCTELACPIMGVPTATGLRLWGRASPVAQSERSWWESTMLSQPRGPPERSAGTPVPLPLMHREGHGHLHGEMPCRRCK